MVVIYPDVSLWVVVAVGCNSSAKGSVCISVICSVEPKRYGIVVLIIEHGTVLIC